MPGQESGKSRAQRIRLDYYRQQDILSSLRRGAIWIAAAAAGLFGLFTLMPVGAKYISTGPLASVHASFENNCQECHLSSPTAAIASDAWRWNPQASVKHLEQACQTCHHAEPHFRELLLDPAMDQDCAGCHREHQGRRHNLNWVSSATCVQCHGRLDGVVIDTHVPSIQPDVREFTSSSHGDFRSLQTDAGQVRFDHAQHVAAGQVAPGAKGAMRLNMLSEPWRTIYRKDGQSDDDLIQLSCQDCHQPHSLHTSGFVGAADREINRHHEPVKFDAHCAGCHELNYVGRTEDQLPVPHAAPWSEVQALLAAKLQTHALPGEILHAYQALRREPMPGDSNRSEDLGPIESDGDAMAWIVANVRERCLLCHRADHLTDEFIAMARTRKGNALIPRRWLQRGLFDHAAHARMDCAFCHPISTHAPVTETASATQTSSANDHDHVMIRGIESCTGCHRPETAALPPEWTTPETVALLAGQPTWASDQCVLCHRYHWTRP